MKNKGIKKFNHYVDYDAKFNKHMFWTNVLIYGVGILILFFVLSIISHSIFQEKKATKTTYPQ